MDAEVRSRHMKNMWAAVNALDAEKRAQVRANVPAMDARMIEESSPVAWLPGGINVRATEAIWSALAPGAREAFFRRLGGADFESSLLRTTVRSAIRLFGLDPGKLLRWTPRGWAQVFRDRSQLRVIDADPRTTRILFENLPPELAESDAWMRSVPASLEAFFDLTQHRGTAALEKAEPRLRKMTLVFRWE